MTPCYTRHETAPGTHADIPHEHERLDMSETFNNRAAAFINGAKTALDTMDSQYGGKHERSEYWRGYRNALDHFGELVDELEANDTEASL